MCSTAVIIAAEYLFFWSKHEEQRREMAKQSTLQLPFYVKESYIRADENDTFEKRNINVGLQVKGIEYWFLKKTTNKVILLSIPPECAVKHVRDYASHQYYLHYEKSRRLQAKSSEDMPEKSRIVMRKFKYPRIRNEISVNTW